MFVLQNITITLESDHRPTFFLIISRSKAILLFTPIHPHCIHLRLVSLRMTREVFLLLILALQLLHLAQGATTCQGDNCPTGIFLSGAQFLIVLCCLYFISYSFPISGLIISGGATSKTSIETFPAEANCTIPPFPYPGNLSSLSSFYSPPKGEVTTPSLSSTLGSS